MSLLSRDPKPALAPACYQRNGVGAWRCECGEMLADSQEIARHMGRYKAYEPQAQCEPEDIWYECSLHGPEQP